MAKHDIDPISELKKLAESDTTTPEQKVRIWTTLLPYREASLKPRDIEGKSTTPDTQVTVNISTEGLLEAASKAKVHNGK